MKAMICTNYGTPDVLQLKEIEKPAIKDNEVLVRNHATSVNYGDLAARNFKNISPQEFNMPWLFWVMVKFSFGLTQPKITVLGSEFAGEVEAVGKAVNQYKPGDQVFGYLGERMGAYAEYICVPENGCLALKPANMTYEEAAIVPYGAIMALNLITKMNLQPGQKVLIIGASGAIGSAAVQICKQIGAKVSGVCATPRLDFVKALGADKVIDYTQEDFTHNGETYDLIFDVLGRSTFSKCKASLVENGRYLRASFKLKQLMQMLWTSLAGGKKVICSMAPGSVEDLHTVKGLIEAGKIKAIIDRKFPIEQAAEAHAYIENGKKKGCVAITIA